MLGRVAILLAMTFASFTSSSASENCPPQEQDLAALKILLVKNPDILARQEAGAERPRFLAVMGYAATFPGLGDDPGRLKCLFRRTSMMPMPGTSDVLCSDGIIGLQPVAARFAERYNHVLAQAMDLKCP